jgi:hypothetical protein
MVAFWRELRCRSPAGSALGAAMPMPAVPAEAPATGNGAAAAPPLADAEAWLPALAPLDGGSAAAGSPADAPRLVPPTPVAAVWEPVEGCQAQRAATYDACFQGF